MEDDGRQVAIAGMYASFEMKFSALEVERFDGHRCLLRLELTLGSQATAAVLHRSRDSQPGAAVLRADDDYAEDACEVFSSVNGCSWEAAPRCGDDAVRLAGADFEREHTKRREV